MKDFFDFVKNSPTPFHATENIRRMLLDEGYTELNESDEWALEPGGKYFTVRHGSALAAFRAVPEAKSFMIAASHTDSPALKVKISEESIGGVTRLPVEKYGGMIMYSWLDRPLSVAGRVAVRCDGGISLRLVDLDRDFMTVPSIAVHLNRNVNDGYKFNPAKDTVPLISSGISCGALRRAVADRLGVTPQDILNHDLFAYVREEPRTVGSDGSLILSPRLDDLECVWASYKAFVSAQTADSVPVFAVFDNEEVGSASVSGADSSFLPDVMLRIAGTRERYIRMLASSLAVSADNAHAKHPNAPELSDADNAPVLGGGVVIKYNANKRYATDGVSAAVFEEICLRANVKTQSYYNRADMPGGSTIGAILNTQLAVLTVDIGLAQLAMHSAVETADVRDLPEMQRALKAFFETALELDGDNIRIRHK